MIRRLKAMSSSLSKSSGGTSSIPNPYPVFKSARDRSQASRGDFINIKRDGGLRILELDRPASLHALNLAMLTTITKSLKTWEESSDCRVIILCSTEAKSKSFCAGGDVVLLARKDENQLGNGPDLKQASEFFKMEYELDYLVGTFKKPIISLLDGIVMGGGAGLGINATIRIATENTRFAMPENSIGLFPDAGSSFFLTRLPYWADTSLGRYLALTGSSLYGIDCFYAGLATHFIPSRRLPDLVRSLSVADNSSLEGIMQSFSGLEEIPSEDSAHCESISQQIREAFSPSHGTIEEIICKLEKMATQSQWALSTLNNIKRHCPTSLNVANNLMKLAPTMSLGQVLQLEYNLMMQFVQKVPDMHKGIINKLVQKRRDPPIWSPDIAQLDYDVKWDAQKLDLAPERDTKSFVKPFDLVNVDQIRTLALKSSGNVSLEEIIIKVIGDCSHPHKMGYSRCVKQLLLDHLVPTPTGWRWV